MPKIPALTPRKLLRALQKIDFKIDHITGSHYILYQTQTGQRITLPFHNRDLPKGTIHALLKTAGISYYDLIRYL